MPPAYAAETPPRSGLSLITCYSYVGAAHLKHASALVERLQGTITELIRTNHPGGAHWQDHLPLILFALRNATSGSTELPPAVVLCGRELRLPGTLAESLTEEMTHPAAGSTAALYRLRAIWDLAAGRTAQVQRRDKQRRDARTDEPVKLEPNDCVLLRIPPNGESETKLNWSYTGPYRVEKVLENGNVKLFEHDLPRAINPVVHESQVRLFLTRTDDEPLTMDEYLIDSINGRTDVSSGRCRSTAGTWR